MLRREIGYFPGPSEARLPARGNLFSFIPAILGGEEVFR
jgi:hypothetical protein